MLSLLCQTCVTIGPILLTLYQNFDYFSDFDIHSILYVSVDCFNFVYLYWMYD